jgi:3-phenylpropionate/trans-cinnamate dioxygenase ferredoxin reductase subunit
MSASPVVIVGGSYAAVQAAAAAREQGYLGSITIISEEEIPPYQRPPLSKAFLLGRKGRADLALRGDAFYARNRIDLLLKKRVAYLSLMDRRVVTSDGERIDFGQLVLCTGARARTWDIAAGNLDGIHYLRNVADAERILAAIPDVRNAVIIGAGYVGLEVASALRSLGKAVTVVEAAERVMTRTASPATSRYVQDLHERHGVRFHFGSGVSRLDRNSGHVRGVVLNDGQTLPCDLLLVSIGMVPNIELLPEALRDDRGVLVNEFGRSIAPLLYAAGDCTSQLNRHMGGRIRLESVQNAIDQAKSVGAALAGVSAAYDAVPWFWSDQYDMKLQSVGRASAECAVRGDPASGHFTMFYRHDGRLVGADSFNNTAEHMLMRQLLTKGWNVPDPILADPSITPREIVAIAMKTEISQDQVL